MDSASWHRQRRPLTSRSRDISFEVEIVDDEIMGDTETLWTCAPHDEWLKIKVDGQHPVYLFLQQ